MSVRDYRLDFVKGFLVFVMALYHSMNYFSDAAPELYGYLRFVNGAFVFISGYVISLFYQPSAGRDVRSRSVRLVTRGLKLLLIFTALNVTISALGLTSYRSAQFDLGGFLSELPETYLHGDSAFMAFRILLPIAYVLLLAPLILVIRTDARAPALLILGGAFFYSWLGGDWPNLYFLLVGLVGLVAGRVVAYGALYQIKSWTVLLFGFVTVCAAMNFLSGNVAAYSLGIFVVLKLVYDWAGSIDHSSRFYGVLVLAGQYSLVAYISQIAFLYFLRLVLPDALGRTLVFSLALVLTGALMIVLPAAIARMRTRFDVVDRLYRLAFA